ncbi:hypothetical protein NHX12_023788 [Muraenolepis orangiensis]|uniref:Uncharacterized protein n=1 Tax=Muraenolepis orangiensis TaxID=630683 RepID=A0A9Q0ISE6_9TELE|nr:hypothetical protein NHX12_023788 [Muraenolepis orangiensis]
MTALRLNYNYTTTKLGLHYDYTTTTLRLHYVYSVVNSHTWSQMDQQNMVMPPPLYSRWGMDAGSVPI